MKIKNDNSTYGVLARLFHWLTFLILLIQLPLGLYLDNLEFSEFKLTVENTHIIIGMSIFYITLLRMIWKFLNPKPITSTVNKLQLIASKAVHGFFYITLLLITISGVLKLLLSGEEVNLIISTIYIDYFNYELADRFQTVHVISAYFLILLFTIHLGAVVYHHLIQKDPILKKML